MLFVEIVGQYGKFSSAFFKNVLGWLKQMRLWIILLIKWQIARESHASPQFTANVSVIDWHSTDRNPKECNDNGEQFNLHNTFGIWNWFHNSRHYSFYYQRIIHNLFSNGVDKTRERATQLIKQRYTQVWSFYLFLKRRQKHW